MTQALSQPASSLGDEVRRLARLAWPLVVAQLSLMALGFVDTLMVGRLGGDALAAISLGNMWSFTWAILGLGTAMGLDPLVAQAHGAGEPRRFTTAVVQGGLVLTLLSAILGLAHLAAGPGLRLLHQPESVIPLATAYCWVLAPATPAFVLFELLRRALQARGQVQAPMVVALAGNVVNVAANLVLIFGIGSWAGLGAIGAAWSTLVVRWFMFGALAWLARDILADAARAWRDAFDPAGLARVARTALPVGAQFGLEVWAFEAALVMVGWFGSTALAAHAVVLTLVSLSFMVPLGLSSAASSRIGNLIGAGHDASRAAWLAVVVGGAVMAVSGSVYAAFPAQLVRAFIPGDPEVVALAATFLPIAALFQIFDGVQVVAFGVLRGAGDTRVPAVANVVGFWLFGLPVGYLIATSGWGPQGVWMGLAIALGTVAGLLLIRIRHMEARGRLTGAGRTG